VTGIAAILSAGPVSQSRLDRMLGAMEQRAADGTGRWTHGRLALGACVLHTSAESLEADQPHANEDGSLVVAFDGYLTNWEELRSDLLARGAALRNRSDAELVLRAYEQWGEDCASRIEGEFAFVIADRRLHRLYAARDHQGLRPLYTCRVGEDFLAASDIGAIIAALDRKPEPDLDYLAGVASNQFFLREGTPWQGISLLSQANWLCFDGVQQRQQRYYDLPFGTQLRYKRDEEYAEHYRAMLIDAVRRTSRTHLPLSVAVSGGLDSSALYCIAHDLEAGGRLLAPGLQGYTLAGDPATSAYELPYARAAAAHVGRSLIEVPLFEPGIDWFTAEARKEQDLPIPHNGAMTIGIERLLQQNGSRVFLNGEGGDEWLQGSARYYREYAERWDLAAMARALSLDARVLGWHKALPVALRIGLPGFLPEGVRELLRQYRRKRRYADPANFFWLRDTWRKRLLEQQIAYEATLPTELGPWLKLNMFASPYGAFARTRMQRQRGMNGIEARQPMLTRQFIEFSVATPENLRNRGGLTKHVHRIGMRGIVPDVILDRTTKAYFEPDFVGPEFARFIVGEGREHLDPLCDRAGIDRLIAIYGEEKVDHDWSWEIWGLYAVAAFLSHHTVD